MPPEFTHIDHWIFDLDNVLYPAECDLFALIDEKMGEYIQKMLDCDPAQARVVQKRYFHDHGTTLAGLMHHHDTDPQDFLDFVHDIDMDRLSPAPKMRAAIKNLPGEKLIFTNADRPYAEKVLERRGLGGLFDHMHDILDCALIPKPEAGAYDSLIAATGVNPKRSVFIEDMARNLRPAKYLGMSTVWINTGSAWGARDHDPDWIDHEIPDLESWITTLAIAKKDKTS